MQYRIVLSLAASLAFAAVASAFNFSVSTLQGVSVGPITSIQFGPDHRLYAAQVNGQLKIFTIKRNAPNNYSATATEVINLVRDIPNYNDTGERNTALTTRQVTGLLVVGTSTNPVIYVSSSDPRIGGGSGGVNDTNLDTNSGIISRLTRTGGVWSKVDLVRGLPRSEENHSTNGLQLDSGTNILYAAQGGNTNAGSPSINFAYMGETALSAAILSIDLNALNALPVKTDAYGQRYVYDLPTLDDPNPNRARNTDGSNLNDPFGGNDGLNQAKLVPGGPVQIHSSGYRNPYDLVLTHAPGRAGRMYTFDNGANPGWGGYPQFEGTPNVTNQYVAGEPGSVNNLDNLHLVTPGYYAGHPCPVRANPGGAGWFRFDESLPDGSQKVFSLNPTSDWPAVPVSMAHPVESDFRQPGVADGALMTYGASTNGLTEYTATNFSGQMQGNLIAASYNGNVLRIALSPDGTAVTNGVEVLASGFGNLPLDVTAPDPAHGLPLVGTVWVSHYSPGKISILEPADFDNPGGSTCTGIDSFEVDEDGDGYSNADELANGSDPCSAAVRPPDWDADNLSDELDDDDDNDGILDTRDAVPLDPTNGAAVPATVHYELFNETGIGFYGVGFTGLMMNRSRDYLPLITPDNAVAGGTAGLFTLSQTGAGTARGSANNQKDAYQFAYNSTEFSPPFVVTSRLAGPFFNGTPTGAQMQGIQLGSGDQDNYVSVALHANAGAGGIEVVYERAGVVQSATLYPLEGVAALSTIDLSFAVDPLTGSVQPRYQLPEGAVVPLGSPILVGGDVLMALMGQTPFAIGLFANTGGAGTASFPATWDFFEVSAQPSTAIARITIDPNSTNMATASTYTNGSFVIRNFSTAGQEIQSVTFDLSTAILPDLVFDVAGTAGDAVAKGFTPNTSLNGVVVAGGVMTHPHNGADSQDGYDGLDVNFTTFPASGTFSFSVDIDPNNVKGVAQPGEHDSASVSGVDLIGTTATVYFNDGTVERTRVGQIAGSVSGSYGWARSDKPPRPGLAIVGQTAPFTTGTADQTIRVSGPSGLTVALVRAEAGLYLGGVPGGGYQVQPYDANTVVGLNETSGVIGPQGYVDLPVTLTKADPKAGYNFFTATLEDTNGVRGPASSTLEVRFDPSLGGDTQPPTQPGTLTFTGVTANSVTVNWTAATDNVAVTGYRVSRGTTVLGTVNDLSYTDAGLAPSTTYAYSVVAVDDAGNTSPATTGSVATLAAQLPTSVRINAGGPTYVDSKSQTWSADTGYNTGTTRTVTNAIAGTSDQALFKTERYDGSTAAPELQYTVPLQNGNYTVRLYFAETYTGTQGTGLRLFDVNIQGQLAFANVDIYTQAGGANKALILSAPATVTNNQITIQFIHKVQNPKINAIEIIPATTADTTPPSAPGALTTSGLTASSVTLHWTASTDNVGVAGYRVSRGGTLLATVTSPTYADSSLSPNTTYNYSVVAVDAAGNASAAATISITTPSAGDTTPPSTPASLSPSNLTTNSVTLSWTASTDNVGVTGYRVSRDGTLLTTVTSLSFTDTGLSSGTAYAYSVAAVDAAGNASAPATTTITTPVAGDTQPPSAPGALNFTNVTATSVTINWSAATDNVGVTSYRISRGGVTLATVNALTYADSSLTPATAYAYSVVAVDAANNVSPASSATVTTAATTTPAAVRINAGGQSYVDVSGNTWSADKSYNTGGAVTNTATVTGTTDPTLFKTERYDPSAAPELLYTLSVPNGSYTVRLYFAETYGPTQGAGLRVFDVKVQAQSTFTGVDIFSQAGGANKALILTAPATVTAGKLTIQFIHRVQNPKVNAIEVVPATLADTQPPSTPTGLAATGVTASEATLNWTASTDNVGVTGYRVTRNGTLLNTVTGTMFSDTGLTAGTAYDYGVTAVDAAGNASPAATLQVTTASPAYALRVNAGGPTYVDSANNTWVADTGFNTGKMSTESGTVSGTTAPQLFKTVRFDEATSPELMYTFGVPNGTYRVRLHFAETNGSLAAVGKRVFDIRVQSNLTFPGVDIFAQAGGAWKALVLETSATVTNGQLQIQFIHKVNNPRINAIELLSP